MADHKNPTIETEHALCLLLDLDEVDTSTHGASNSAMEPVTMSLAYELQRAGGRVHTP